MPGYRNIPINTPCYSRFATNGEQTFCLTIADLESCGVSNIYIRKALNGQRIGSYTCWPHHKEGRTVYIHYDGLKSEYKEKIRVVFLQGLTPEKWYEENGKAEDILHRLEPFALLDPEDEQVLESARYPNGEKLQREEICKASETCRWLTMFIRLSKKEDIKTLGYQKMADLYSDAIFLFKKKGIRLPLVYTKIRQKITQYKAEGAICCIDNRGQSNVNAAKIYDDDQIAVLRTILGRAASYNAQQAADMYNMFAEAMGWEKISRRSVVDYMKKYYRDIKAGRDGSEAFRNKISMQPRRTAPKEALSFWSIDGWTAELYYKKQTKDKKGHTVTTYTNRLTVVVVMDAFNKYPVGYAIGENESVELIQAAVKNAMDHCREVLGEYFRPYQIQSDRFGIKSLSTLYEDVAEYFTPARVKNAKTKPVERYFLHLNRDYCQLFFGNMNWSGHGIKAKEKYQPNIDILNANKHKFPEKEGVIKQIEWIMFKEREKKQHFWIKGWQKMPQADRLTMTREMYLYKFGTRNDRTKRLEAGVFNPTILGEVRNYDSFDLDFRKYPLQSWVVIYDKEDLTTILVTDETEKRRFVLEAIHEQPMALRDRKPGDFEALKRIDRFNKEVLEPSVVSTIASDEERIMNLIEQTPQLEGWRAATMITDSRGQHKQYLQHSSLIKSDEDLIAEIEERQLQKVAREAKKQQKKAEIEEMKRREAAHEKYALEIIGDIDKYK